ncbi:ABC transporter permease [Flavilitoribacter nigricans]|uniref:Macrolide ABC transporter permease n=1 Tax=Flavilitoribacter nigricans (strain ATCC 23147 / DSM 23189 / NBRC 102662 / NCIMB 1420 / SS-2) TaxID=1122177 RepID=A0A2D0N319_FLAN2|nr:ABC transporter permease [Flavilitoribacter nigricans]PHN02800.1 macrolide ABC transporter permease [Flavilitoribacter nigricans DSM 23189 = NBRC 102662]
MLRNYLKIALRQARRNPSTTLINVAGLSIGISVCFLIGLFVWDEWQFDQYHPDKDRIYRITAERGGEGGAAHWAGTSPAYAPTLAAEFPEVERTTRLYQIRQKLLFTHQDNSFLEADGFFAENSIFDLFALPFRYGTPTAALSEPNTIVLSPELARKYFGDENPVGQTIKINSDEVKVTGVLESRSPHFHLDFDYLLSFENLLNQVPEERINSWVWQDFYNYVKVFPGTDPKTFTRKLSAYVEQHAHPQTKEHGFYYYPVLQPLTDIHLHSGNIHNDAAVRGNSRYVNGLALVGIFLLVIAGINFVNMSTARAAKRANEVGIRKATGAQQNQLRKQFLAEATIIVSIAMLIALPLTRIALPFLNNFTDKSLEFSLFSNAYLPLIILGLTLLIGLLAGSYPAFVLAAFRPAAVLKGGLSKPSGHVNWLRKALVTTQFSLSILLISCVLIILRQMNFLNQSDLGFEKEQLIHFPMKGSMFKNMENTKEEFLKISGVASASTCFGIPGDIVSGDNIIVPGENRRSLPARIFNVDHDYIGTMGMEIIAGRDFSRSIATDATGTFIVNETALKELDIAATPEEAIGKRLEWKMWMDKDTIKQGTIIGVVRDFHYNSMHENVETTVLQIYPDSYWKMVLRLNSGDLSETLAAIESQWDAFETGYPIDYQFVDAGFQAMYENEQKLSRLLLIFTVLAVFIACIGAFGLAVYATEQKRKEIGIRKVLGASVGSIVALMSRDFLKLVLIALLIATPIAWFLMQSWLNDFAYRIDMEWWIFAAAGVLALAIAFVTVGSQSFKAALTDPVQSLRNE